MKAVSKISTGLKLTYIKSFAKNSSKASGKSLNKLKNQKLKVIKFLWKHFKNYKASLAIVALCSILTAAVNLSEPYLTAKFIDEILIGRDAATFYAFIAALAAISVGLSD